LSWQLEEAKKDGYAWEIEESTDHIRCFAVPVRIQGKITGAISMAIPLFRYQEEKKEEIIAALQKNAAYLGNLLQQAEE
jgi:DNA-binding IclR family transcriptional regulator